MLYPDQKIENQLLEWFAAHPNRLLTDYFYKDEALHEVHFNFGYSSEKAPPPHIRFLITDGSIINQIGKGSFFGRQTWGCDIIIPDPPVESTLPVVVEEPDGEVVSEEQEIIIVPQDRPTIRDLYHIVHTLMLDLMNALEDNRFAQIESGYQDTGSVLSPAPFTWVGRTFNFVIV